MSKDKLVVINSKDNVATALLDLKKGEHVTYSVDDKSGEVLARENIRFGHKIALESIAVGDSITKFGEAIGIATRAINIGEHVHIHNVKSIRGSVKIAV